jgi:hypothetical protein
LQFVARWLEKMPVGYQNGRDWGVVPTAGEGIARSESLKRK